MSCSEAVWNSSCVLRNIVDSRSLPGFQIKPACLLFLALEVLGPQIVEDCKRIVRNYCYVLDLFLCSSLGICCGQEWGTGQSGALIRPGYAISDLLSAAFDCPVRTVKAWQVMFLVYMRGQLELVKNSFSRRWRTFPI